MSIVTYVATREGGVDRNIKRKTPPFGRVLSPPARVAWIETKPPSSSS